ncbi:hypothetical protein AJ81_03855 [Pseudothermotoga hypogea DSM 11164 = NBRC 106472]|uniref:Uncharacterized protein n=1 Tax=Pseudothermotoga hypogea DSM 11164 = NBRC 106472 TaxID=1123384 RepID=A0A0X1KTV9_9THEM|nr:hypothetical protein AJ81_03855 [Pseudothermotoga hypogea DSM 11164 = NBRC 106472]
MRGENVRKIVLFLSVLSVLVFAVQPHEKVIFKNGNWTTTQEEIQGRQVLIVGYEGIPELLKELVGRKEATKDSISFTVPSDVVLISIHTICDPKQEQKITLLDEKGRAYTTFDVQRFEKDHVVFTPMGELVLKKGKYTLKFSNLKSLERDIVNFEPVVLLIGREYDALKENIAKEVQTQPAKVQGENALLEGKSVQTQSPRTVQRKPIEFTLNESSLIEAVAIDLVDIPKDFPQTNILIVDKNSRLFGPYQVSDFDEENSVIFFSPKLPLASGSYTIKFSDESVLNYRSDGKPIFALKFFPYDPPFDFTGTYKMSFVVKRVATIFGPSEKKTLDVKNFEVGLIDHFDYVELVGKIDLNQIVQLLEEQTGRKVNAEYTEVFPFSQPCKVIDRKKDSLSCAFDLSLNFSDMPAVNRFIVGTTTVAVVLTFKTRPGLTPGVMISGSAKYIRIDDPHLGTDVNDYVISGDGYRFMEQLPPFVTYAMNKKLGSAGNIPGPSSAEQMATGLLFPPLVAAIGYALQELLKPKPGGVAEVFQDYTRAQRGAARRAAAREAASEAVQSEAVSETESEVIEEETEEYEEAPIHEPEPVEETQRPSQKEPEVTIPEIPQTVLEVPVDIYGRTVQIAYDPLTDEWYNTETGNIFNMEIYSKVVLPNLPKDKAFIEAQRQKMQQPTKLEGIDLTREEYMRRLEQKYGVSRDQLKDKISQSVERSSRDAERYKRDAEWYETAETVAKVTEIVADNAVDALANCTGFPGRMVRAAYKGVKGVAGAAAEGNLTIGTLIDTGTDIASDFINFDSLGEGFKYGKSIVGPATEAVFKTAGSTIGGLIDGGLEGAKESFIESAIDNSFEALAKSIFKGYGDEVTATRGEWWNPELSKLSIPARPSNASILTSPTGEDLSRIVAKKLVNETAQMTAKTANALTSEFAVKPVILGE